MFFGYEENELKRTICEKIENSNLAAKGILKSCPKSLKF